MAEIGLFEAMYTARALRRLKPDPVPEDLITRHPASRVAIAEASLTGVWYAGSGPRWP